MAHYAFLDENNIVTEVIVGIDETELIEGLDPETWYANFRGQKCKRTSYNAIAGKRRNPQTNELTDKIGYRKNYASIGYFYDDNLDAFISPKPFPSWNLDEEICQWQAPKPYPNNDDFYIWDEELGDWVVCEIM
jgi:hypothetical protein